MAYSTSNYYKQLVAACVDSKGVYYIQVFNVGQSAVSFFVKYPDKFSNQ